MQGSKSVGKDIRHGTSYMKHSMGNSGQEKCVSGLGSPVSDPNSHNGVVLTFGVFDGVHIAHQIVISSVVNRARALNVEGVVISFDPHPAFSISGKAPPTLTSIAKKIELLKVLGIDRVVVEDFNERFSQLSPEQFVRDILVGRFHVQEVVVGYDCAFGKDKAGDKWLLKKLGDKCGFAVHIVEPYKINGEVVSSTRIRAAILEGDLEMTHKLLGRYYSISGPVIKGKGLGHKIGYATANLQLQKQLLPPPGVYAVKVNTDEQKLYGVLNMGIQPTFGKNKFRVEVHLLDFKGTLYGKTIEALFVRKIRDERAFVSSEELAEQIRKDEAAAREILDASNMQDS